MVSASARVSNSLFSPLSSFQPTSQNGQLNAQLLWGCFSIKLIQQPFSPSLCPSFFSSSSRPFFFPWVVFFFPRLGFIHLTPADVSVARAKKKLLSIISGGNLLIASMQRARPFRSRRGFFFVHWRWRRVNELRVAGNNDGSKRADRNDRFP